MKQRRANKLLQLLNATGNDRLRHTKLTRDICEARCLGDADKGVNALKGIHRFASIQVPAHPGGVALRKMLTDAEQI
jgi:hypothetical protein